MLYLPSVDRKRSIINQFLLLVNPTRIAIYSAPMLHSEQIRAARSLLDWTQGDLARFSRVGSATIHRIERAKGPIRGNISTLLRIERAFERAGILFIEADSAGGIGLRLVQSKTKKIAKTNRLS